MQEYFIRTANEKYSDIITATNCNQAIQLFKTKYNLKRYKNFVVFPAKDIFN